MHLISYLTVISISLLSNKIHSATALTGVGLSFTQNRMPPDKRELFAMSDASM